MRSIALRSGVYDPAALHTLGYAFDKAFAGLPLQSRQKPQMREKLARSIFRLFDEGETKPLRLSRIALAIVTNSNRWHVSNRGTANTISVLFPSDTNRRPVAA